MPHVEKPPEDFRRLLREKALSHSLFYLKLGAGAPVSSVPRRRSVTHVSRAAPAQPAARAQPRVSELLLHFEGGMHYLRPPRAVSPDISSSDDEDRAAVRRRSRDASDDSAVEVEEPRRRASRASPDMSPRRERTLVEAHVVDGRGRTVRTPSVVVSDWSDAVGASPEEVGWLRARALSADSACSSCSTLSSHDDDFEPAQTKKIVNAD
ncbi:uncharacterized protein LOC121734823 isoform X2 [Aricia agestis]|uniref:uncharacterized protein LOC121734823 isoform X2 n=1 Tax=Aricia agestis TaxID=91739 RepID=UPI001C203DC0|nr:uncharacterized protein LOC121734823 isoform X2 [Aricia agestis]